MATTENGDDSMYTATKVITVYCKECKARYDENKCDIHDCEEGDRGQDIVTFTCPFGHTDQRSTRVG